MWRSFDRKNVIILSHQRQNIKILILNLHLIGYARGLIIGVILEHAFSSRKHEWFVKRMKWRRGVRN